ncbi:hypothetical protein CTRI78_v008671 [Colletotrichum trifolii]|uniref:Uncharacterized protein n=1 Tax=Colletotrichum trifolii TaxID=5466 RepID=A0A4R8QSY6_COLTR|nr:hypothetical protein CTRI78_v008671 [Colletotrichum trifolii]
MCRQFQVLVVCNSAHCRFQQHLVRLPLLRLVPRPNAVYALCQEALRLGCQPDDRFLGVPVATFRPGACPNLGPGADDVLQHCLSPVMSREMMRMIAGCHVLCGSCLGNSRAARITLDNNARLLKDYRPPTISAEHRAGSEWTCCGSGSCDASNFCEYRGASVLCALKRPKQGASCAGPEQAAVQALLLLAVGERDAQITPVQDQDEESASSQEEMDSSHAEETEAIRRSDEAEGQATSEKLAREARVNTPPAESVPEMIRCDSSPSTIVCKGYCEGCDKCELDDAEQDVRIEIERG